MKVTTQPLFDFNWNMIFSVITFLVLFAVLYHFFFKKVHAFMQQRSKDVEDTIARADSREREADLKLQSYEKKMENMELESRKMISSARAEAGIQAETIIKEAEEKAALIEKQTQSKLKQQSQDAEHKLRKEIGNLAVLAAEKIMEKEINPDEQEEVINKILEKRGEDVWN